MKKIFLLTILLFQLTFVFGQNTQWSNWTSMSCYQGFKTSANNLGFVKSINEYSWKMKIKNNYNRKVHFNMSWIVGNEKQSIGRFSLNPGEETNHVSYYFKSNSTSWQVEVTEVCFGENWMSCTNGCYAECDNGSPKQPNCDKNTGSTNSTNQSNNSNQQTTQQNDLSEYNRSKADLERQMAEKNAEGQRKSQNYTTAMNTGISAHNLGNYAEAKNQFSIALNNCNTEEARQKAQEYYNKSVNAEKSQAKIKAIGELTTATTNLITYFANRKNALRNSLSQEDGQALIDIVNSENPTEYVQNIIQIFTDLGYTYRKTEKDNYGTTITMNNDAANINDFMLIFIRPASYSDYNSIGFSYHRKEKLLAQLSVFGNKLEGYKFPEIKGVPPSRKEKVDAIVRKQEEEKSNKEQYVINVNKWVKDFSITNSDIVIDDNITVETILNKNIEAIGGIQKLKEVQNVVINEDYGDGYDHKIIIAFGKYAENTTKPNGKPYSKKIFVGKKGYSVFLGDKSKLLESEKQELVKKEPIDILSIQKLQLTIGKILEFNGKDCYTLINEERATFGENLFYINTYFFDVTSGLLIGKTQYLNTKPNDKHYDIYEDYESIDGILFYTKETSFYDSDKKTTVVIDGQLKKNAYINKRKIKINQNLTDKDFE